jgi:hypothetical protein
MRLSIHDLPVEWRNVPRMSDPSPNRRLTGGAALADGLVRELLDARLIGVLATLDPGGEIHAVPMWYATSDGAIVLATSSRSRKVACLEGDPRATFVLHDSRPGLEVCGASIVGTVEILRGAEALPLVDLVHLRYVTARGAGDPVVAEFLASDDVALRLVPDSATTWDERASGAAHALGSSGGALALVSTSPRPR